MKTTGTSRTGSYLETAQRVDSIGNSVEAQILIESSGMKVHEVVLPPSRNEVKLPSDGYVCPDSELPEGIAALDGKIKLSDLDLSKRSVAIKVKAAAIKDSCAKAPSDELVLLRGRAVTAKEVQAKNISLSVDGGTRDVLGGTVQSDALADSESLRQNTALTAFNGW